MSYDFSEEMNTEENSMSVFKSYLRGLLDDLTELRDLIDSGQLDKAKAKLDRLIDNAQRGVED